MLNSKTPYFAVRDFLFYLVPGAVFLCGLFLLAGSSSEIMQGYGDITISIAGIILAYFLGQVAYVATYPLKRLIGGRTAEEAELPEFKDAFMVCVEKHTTFYAAEISRYRNFARFCIAMVVPTAFLGVAIVNRIWAISKWWAVSTAILSCLGIVSFIFRYRRYSCVWIDQVKRCAHFDWKSKCESK